MRESYEGVLLTLVLVVSTRTQDLRQSLVTRLHSATKLAIRATRNLRLVVC